MSWIKRYWYVGVFVLVNLAVAAPLSAGLDDDWCSDGSGEQERCCTICIIFCNCTLI